MVAVGGDADLLHPGEHPDERELDVLEQRGATALGELALEDLGQLDDRSGAHDESVSGVGLVGAVEGQLRRVTGLRAELAVEEAQDQVGEVERPLTRVVRGTRPARCRT